MYPVIERFAAIFRWVEKYHQLVTAFAVCISELDQGFVAGFLEGEASFWISEQNGGQSYSCVR